LLFIQSAHFTVGLGVTVFIVMTMFFIVYLVLFFTLAQLERKSEGFCGRMKEYEFCRLERM